MPKGQKLDAEVLKTRRLEARRLLDEGVAQAEVARRLKISRQSVSRWARLKPRELATVRRQGRKSKFDDAKRSQLRTLLLAGPAAAGHCAVQLRQERRGQPAVVPPGWEVVARVRRPTERDEATLVLRRSQ